MAEGRGRSCGRAGPSPSPYSSAAPTPGLFPPGPESGCVKGGGPSLPCAGRTSTRVGRPLRPAGANTARRRLPYQHMLPYAVAEQTRTRCPQGCGRPCPRASCGTTATTATPATATAKRQHEQRAVEGVREVQVEVFLWFGGATATETTTGREERADAASAGGPASRKPTHPCYDGARGARSSPEATPPAAGKPTSKPPPETTSHPPGWL